jgi:hypothetical protein
MAEPTVQNVPPEAAPPAFAGARAARAASASARVGRNRLSLRRIRDRPRRRHRCQLDRPDRLRCRLTDRGACWLPSSSGFSLAPGSGQRGPNGAPSSSGSSRMPRPGCGGQTRSPRSSSRVWRSRRAEKAGANPVATPVDGFGQVCSPIGLSIIRSIGMPPVRTKRPTSVAATPRKMMLRTVV